MSSPVITHTWPQNREPDNVFLELNARTPGGKSGVIGSVQIQASRAPQNPRPPNAGWFVAELNFNPRITLISAKRLSANSRSSA
jgi:hypothetical protein